MFFPNPITDDPSTGKVVQSSLYIAHDGGTPPPVLLSYFPNGFFGLVTIEVRGEAKSLDNTRKDLMRRWQMRVRREADADVDPGELVLDATRDQFTHADLLGFVPVITTDSDTLIAFFDRIVDHDVNYDVFMKFEGRTTQGDT